MKYTYAQVESGAVVWIYWMRMMTKVGFCYTTMSTRILLYNQSAVIKDDHAQYYVLFSVKTGLT